jgi:hypothetical protein
MELLGEKDFEQMSAMSSLAMQAITT